MKGESFPPMTVTSSLARKGTIGPRCLKKDRSNSCQNYKASYNVSRSKKGYEINLKKAHHILCRLALILLEQGLGAAHPVADTHFGGAKKQIARKRFFSE
jgi:hypothetical protein